ncbi:MAG: hypothetical protein WD512_15110, partial [Candidatus Paceibacterota bacterium]
ETWNNNFEDCKKSIFENFIVGGREVECDRFMRQEDMNYILEIMKSKDYSIYSGSEMISLTRNPHHYDLQKFYITRSKF